MKHILLLAGLLVGLSKGYSQPLPQALQDRQAVLQLCFDLEVLERHCQKNKEILYLTLPAILRRVPAQSEHLSLRYHGKPVLYAPKLFDTLSYNYELMRVKVGKRRARIRFKKAPNFNTVAMKRKGFAGFLNWGTYFDVDIKFKKKRGKWFVWKYTIKDLVFVKVGDYNLWAKKKYIPLTEAEKEFVRKRNK